MLLYINICRVCFYEYKIFHANKSSTVIKRFTSLNANLEEKAKKIYGFVLVTHVYKIFYPKKLFDSTQ